MKEPWESDEPETAWTDPEAWRGEQHPAASDDWCRDAGEGLVWAGDDELGEDDQEETPGWPENLAGPEYWMYRQLDR